MDSSPLEVVRPGGRTLGVLILFGALALLPASTVVAAGSPPDSANLVRLDSALRMATRARLTTTQGVVVLSETRAELGGVNYQHLLLSQRSDTLRSPGLIAWSEIRTIETQGGARRGWLSPGSLGLTGGLIGGGVGIVGAFVGGWASAGGLSYILFPALGVAVGAGAGKFVERRGSIWQPLYP